MRRQHDLTAAWRKRQSLSNGRVSDAIDPEDLIERLRNQRPARQSATNGAV